MNMKVQQDKAIKIQIQIFHFKKALKIVKEREMMMISYYSEFKIKNEN
jgi:hypothetical protein